MADEPKRRDTGTLCAMGVPPEPGDKAESELRLVVV